MAKQSTAASLNASCTAAPSPYVAVLLSPVNSAFRVQLEPGKYLIGRSAVPIDDLCFINLESPRSAVSRNHATVVFCRNGDAWLEDNASTNGTFLAIREGEGLRLEPQHFYQLTSGALIVFGDMEVQFFVEPRPDGFTSTPAARAKSAGRTALPALLSTSQPSAAHHSARAPAAAPSPSIAAAAPKLDSSGALALVAHLANLASDVTTDSAASLQHGGGGTNGQKGSRGAADGTPPASQKNKQAVVAASVPAPQPPVLLAAASVKDEPRPSGGRTSAKGGGKVAATRPRDQGQPDSVDADVARPSARARRDDGRTFRTFGSKTVACLTGFDSKARAKCAKLMQSGGGAVEGEWSDACNLLIVNESPTGRTPKLIMAVAQGRDVVVPAFVEKGDVSVFDACPAVVSEGGATISAAKLRDAIWKYRDLGAPLANRSFYTGGIEPKATRDQVNVILKACGGAIAKTKAADATVLADSHLNEFYNSILRGEGTSR